MKYKSNKDTQTKISRVLDDKQTPPVSKILMHFEIQSPSKVLVSCVSDAALRGFSSRFHVQK